MLELSLKSAEEVEVGEEVTLTEEDGTTFGEMIDVDAPAEPFLPIDGKRVYKTSCLKAITSSQKLSKDRLRRVQGMSTFPSEAQTTSNADNLLLIGNPILIVDPKEGQSVANVVKITKSNQSLKEIGSSSSFIDVEFVLRKIDTEEINRNLYWKGTMIQGTFSYPGENCLPI